jgi:hypothetical protein
MSSLQTNFPAAQGYWAELFALFTTTPVDTAHLTFTVLPVAQVALQMRVIFPIPDAVPAAVPTADEIASCHMLWGKVLAKATRPTGEVDLVVQVIAGRGVATAAGRLDPLPATSGLTFLAATNLLVPTPLLELLNQDALREGTAQLAAEAAGPPKGNKYLSDVSTLCKGANLDGRVFYCTNKKEFTARMDKVQVLTRLFSEGRAEKYLSELIFNKELFKDTCQTMLDTELEVAQTHVDFGLQKYSSLKKLEVMMDGFDDGSRFLAALHLQFNATDFTKVSILDFVEAKALKAVRFVQEPADHTGRDLIKVALENLERFMAAFCHQDFKGALQPVIDQISSGDRLWDDFDDAYLLFRVQKMLQKYGMCVSNQLRDAMFDTISMLTPKGCADLLTKYAEQLVKDAKGLSDGWNVAPHYKFYKSGGSFESFKFRANKPAPKPAAQKRERGELEDLDEGGEIQKEGGKPQRQPKKAKTAPKIENLVCYKFMASKLGVKDSTGKVLCCEGECRFPHKGLSETSGLQARQASKSFIRDVTIRNNLKEAVKARQEWKVAEGQGQGQGHGQGQGQVQGQGQATPSTTFRTK